MRGGLVILTGLLIAAVLIVNLQAVRDLTRDRLDLVVIVPEASGVGVGTSVWVEGVESGRVLGIRFMPLGDSVEVALNVRVDGATRAVLRQDSDARALRQRFIGQPLVTLSAGTPGAPPVRDGDTLRARPFIDPMDLLDRVRELPSSLSTLMEQVERVSALAEARRPELELLGQRVDAAAEAAAGLSADLEGGSLGPLLADEGFATRLGALRQRIGALSDALGTTMERYRGSEDEESELMAALQRLSGRVDRIRGDLAELDGGLEGGGGLLTRMQRDSALEVAIRGVQEQMDSVRAEAASIVLRMLIP